MNRIDKLYLAAKDLFPKRIYLAVRIDGEERKFLRHFFIFILKINPISIFHTIDLISF